MLFSVKRVALLVFITALSGCGGSEQNISTEPVNPTPEQLAQTRGSVIMDFSTSTIPFPHDALFSGSTDGTLNLPVADADNMSDPKVALNALDGFSTTAPISFTLSKAIALDDVNSNTMADVLEQGVKIFKTTTNPQTKAVNAVHEPLVLGVDYVVQALDAKTVVLVPLKPLAPKTTYLMVVTDALLNNDDEPMVKGFVYENLSGQVPLSGSLAQLEPLRQLTNAHLSALAQTNFISSNQAVIGSWTFSTQSTSDVLEQLNSTVNNTTLNVFDTNLTTLDFTGSNGADVYAGTLTVPYYLTAPSVQNPLAALTSFWQGVQSSWLTQFNVTPVATEQRAIPVLMTIPNTGTKPVNGWPVVVFQHGITQNRGSLLAVANALAAAGFAAIAIDMPLHGITPSSALAGLRMEGVTERHFEMDWVTQDSNDAIIANQPDGVVDTSGRHFINLSSLLTTRDNLRQAVSDLLHLKASLSGVTEFDATRVAFVGHSLGTMVGGVFAQVDANIESSVFAMPGQQAAYLLAGSPIFGPEIVAGLNAQGVTAGSSEFNQFLLVAQTVIDSADPVNYVANIATPRLVFEVVGDGTDAATQDQVIPNRVTNAPLAGTEPWIALQALSTLTDSGAVASGKGVLRFNAGDHGSILSPAASAEVTQTMQEAMASFIGTQGGSIAVTSNATIAQ